MRQVPPIILEKLAELRRRERLLMFIWGCAWVFSLFIVVLLLACFVDWLVDLWDETPWALREFMLYGQLALAGLAVLILILGPQLRRLRDEMLALLVECKRPELQHRLISALELNRPRARTEGMSPELLAAMTTEAVHQTRPIDFAALADQSRVKRSSLVFLAVAVIAVGLFLLGPETAMALLRRQLLQDVDIPRSVAVASVDPGIWPSGEEIPLRFKVTGPGVTEDRGGSVRVRVPIGADDYRTFSVPLSLESAEEDDTAIYVAKVPPGSVDFSYMAKVGDGRTRAPGQVQYVARPNVIEQKAYLKLHDYAGLNPADALNDVRTSYEQLHPRGDIVGMPGLSARVVVKTQKPMKRAILETYGTPYPDLTGKQPKTSGMTRFQDRANLALANLSGALLTPTPFGRLNAVSAANAGLANLPLRRFEQSFPTPTDEVEWRFDLKPTETSYRVTVFDVYGFASKTESVRTIKIEPEPSPTVSLHPETWPADPKYKSKIPLRSAEILDWQGLPVPLVGVGKAGRLPINYEVFGPYGVGKVVLHVQVYRGGGSSEDEKRLMIETKLPLREVPATDRDFDKTKGKFVDSGKNEQIPFYAVPTSRQAEKWPRVIGGGGFDYDPAGLLDNETGNPFVFQAGDQIVVFLEVYNCNPKEKDALMVRSKVREKEVVTLERFVEWRDAAMEEARRIEQLMFLQQQVYDRKGP